jgi:hypothetical protein
MSNSREKNSNIIRSHWEKKPLQRRLRKNRQKEEKTPKKGDWCPYYQIYIAQVRRMTLPRSPRGTPIKMAPYRRLSVKP